MGREKVSAIALGGFALVSLLGVAWRVQAQDPKASYTSRRVRRHLPRATHRGV